MDNSDKASRREVQEKLNKQYIDSKINPVVEPMALELFTKKIPHNQVVSCSNYSQFWFLGWLHAYLHERELR